MDEALAKALEFSNYRITLNNQKRNLQFRMNSMMTIGYNGHMFTAKLELINFVKQLLDLDATSGIFLDDNDNPCLVADLLDFHSRLLTQYTETLNEYYVEYKKLEKLRNTSKLVGLNV